MNAPLEHIVSKAFSGRWLWTVTAAAVFAFLACSGRLEAKDSLTIIGVVLTFYFTRNDREQEHNGDKKP